jgi:hypothetical protein
LCLELAEGPGLEQIRQVFDIGRIAEQRADAETIARAYFSRGNCSARRIATNAAVRIAAGRR